MSQEIVRAVMDGQEVNVSRGYATAYDLTVLEDEPTQTDDGRERPATRRGGRPAKPTTSVALKASAKKKAAAKSAEPAEPASPPSEES